jgi:hypothetical protein
MPRASTADLVEAARAAGRATAAFNVITLEHAGDRRCPRWIAGPSSPPPSPNRVSDLRIAMPTRPSCPGWPGCRLVSNRSPSCCSVPSCSAGRWT